MGKNEKGEITVNVNEYREFVKAKIKMAELNGVPCEKSEINPILFPHQRDIVQWAVQGGQRAIFAAFGLGKTMMQIEIARILHDKTGARALIVCPLGVRQEFMRDGKTLGVQFEFVRRTEEVEASEGAFFLTNSRPCVFGFSTHASNFVDFWNR